MRNRRNRLRRAALVLALLVLAAIVTGVAASATKTVIPKQLTGSWSRLGIGGITVSPRGRVTINPFGTDHARFSHVTAQRLNISRYSCSGTGTYRWTILNHGDVIGEPGHELKLTKIHDACKQRVGLFSGRWFKGP
jgi:hypothetical protein